MNQTVTLLLLLSGGDATPAERQALVTFQTREKIVLSRVAGGSVSLAVGAQSRLSGGAPTPPGYSADVVDKIEAALDEAQTLAASLDEERALELLAGVERELLAHPELPQAAWLMAERHQATAAIRRKQPGGAEEAKRLVESARALEGPRAEAFGERAEGAAPEPTAPAATTLLAVRDLDRADALVLDGRLADAAQNVLPGRHHVRVVRGSRLAWAGWFDVPAGPRVDKRLGVPERVACSADDLADVTVGTRTPNVVSGVRCARWVAVRRGATGLEVAWCEGERCTAYGPLLREQLETKPKAAMPTWLAATIVGVAAVGAGTVLVATGTFERERPPPQIEKVYRGPR
jgi:hypothetical protein